MPKIIVTDKMSANGVDYLKSRGFEVDTPYGISHEELLKIIGQYDGIIVRSATKVKADAIGVAGADRVRSQRMQFEMRAVLAASLKVAHVDADDAFARREEAQGE